MARRVLIALLVCAGVACLLGSMGTLPAPASKLASFSSQASAKIPHPTAAGLTFAERVAYQRAIEEVYWRHRIWPKENRSPKPPLDKVMSQAQVETKVEDYLRDSRALEDYWQRPITPEQLQAEMERIASHTKQPGVLRELFAALGNDPFVVAECLAKPIVAERLVRELSVRANGRDGSPSPPPDSADEAARSAIAPYQFTYKLPEISPLDCSDDTWTATTTVNAPEARETSTAVWTGSEMIIWGGSTFNGSLNTGGRYDPATDMWMATSIVNAPTARGSQSTVWTGSEIIIWGGFNGIDLLNTGGRYNPITDSWISTGMTNAPAARAKHSAVWTGSEMIIWGGVGCGLNCNLDTGGRYNPSTVSWTTTSTMNAPAARWEHSAVWTGSEMIVWGGSDDMNYLHTGGRYSPATDSWMPTGLVNVPLGRIANTAIWTESEMVVWGGVDETFNDTNTGGRYNPSTDSWIATNLANAPSPRNSHSTVWTGSEMIVWGGDFHITNLDTGGRYEPGTDNWRPTSTVNVPLAREYHNAVWTGTEMVVWAGLYYPSPYLNTGGRYCAQGGPSPTPTATASPTPTETIPPTATPTATSTATATPAATSSATPTSTPRPTPTPRINPTPRTRPTPPPRP